MLMAHPAVLKDLIAQYEALTLLGAEASTPQARQRLADISYTLCVATGTKDVDMALIAGRHRLSGARPEDDSLLQSSLPQASALQAPLPAERTSAV
ncbi:DUF5133 domain-containing protein [Streptomyces sp. 5-8]|uniref:DUF5133 domain-containing protein n=1 Tax=Streptomyces musisoli TaxID=2802280 RepID=A0ABS1P840_9ACTN|nr:MULTISPECIES: DUF5133 domain-containing protein [Streptomyces]MBL1108529.1 DUF5133 domain-containing protein [Streptomyces musisoli]MBY8841259.1 DUF5133 domain-containing protein [Streptomyces sp. SP2-10]